MTLVVIRIDTMARFRSILILVLLNCMQFSSYIFFVIVS